MSWYNPLSWGGSSGSSDSEAQEYLAKIEPMLHQYYDPYVNMGQRTMGTLENEYNQLINDPASIQRMLGEGYTQSPGYQYAYEQEMNALNQSLAAGGMLGTPTAQNQSMEAAQGIASQDYWQYYGANSDLYNTGLSGTSHLFDTGFNATNQLAGGLSNVYGSQANLAYAGNQSQDEMLASLLGAGIGAAGYAFGGPVGGAAASTVAKGFI